MCNKSLVVCVVRAIHRNVINSNEHTHAPKKLLTEWEVGCFANIVEYMRVNINQ